VHVVAAGSSALKLGAGSKESLAGRFERITLTHWTAPALAATFGLSPEAAALEVVQRGSYPRAVAFRDDRRRWAACVRDAILEPAIGCDVLALTAVRKPALLRQVFAVCASAPAEIVSLQKLQGQVQDRGALETVASYLGLLEDAHLVAALGKHASRPARRRAAPPKLVTLSNAFLAVVDPRGIPARPNEPDRFGRWVENVCLALAWNSSQRLSYWRQEPYEVDRVLEGRWGAWAIEVKTGAASSADCRGLLEFTRLNPRFGPSVVCDEAGMAAAERARLQGTTWTDFLLRGPPGTT
jgi:predicted AAA+ superfamily ATPase